MICAEIRYPFQKLDNYFQHLPNQPTTTVEVGKAHFIL